MAGFKQRYKIRGEDGRIRTVTAQSHQGAKRTYARGYGAPIGYRIVVWPMGDEGAQKEMRITSKDKKSKPR